MRLGLILKNYICEFEPRDSYKRILLKTVCLNITSFKCCSMSLSRHALACIVRDTGGNQCGSKKELVITQKVNVYDLSCGHCKVIR